MLCEAAGFDIVLLALLTMVSKRKAGLRTFIYFTGYALGRFFLEFYRGDNLPVFLGLTIAQVTSVIIIIFSLLIKRKLRLNKLFKLKKTIGENVKAI